MNDRSVRKRRRAVNWKVVRTGAVRIDKHRVVPTRFDAKETKTENDC